MSLYRVFLRQPHAWQSTKASREIQLSCWNAHDIHHCALQWTDPFRYAKVFQHRWTNMYLQSALLPVEAGVNNTFGIDGTTITVRIPAENSGTRGIVIADPCYHSPWVGCSYGGKLQTFDRLTGILNAAMAHSDVDYWASEAAPPPPHTHTPEPFFIQSHRHPKLPPPTCSPHTPPISAVACFGCISSH